MRGFRLFAGDIWSGGVLTLLTIGFVVAQLVLAGWTCGSRAAESSGSGTVICHGAGGTSIGSALFGGKDLPSEQRELSCIAHCAATIGSVGQIDFLEGGAAYDASGAVSLLYSGLEAIPVPLLDAGTIPFPTGPPIRSA